jgi:cyclic-di-GMP-binding protein
MGTFSFDVVSDYDKAEINNVYDQARREVESRYDFQGTSASIEWLGDKAGLVLTGDSDYQIEAMLDMIRKKMATRGVNQKTLDTSKGRIVSGFKTTQDVPFLKGLDQDKAKQVTKLLREKLPKLKTSIQGEEIRVSSGSKDDLQAAMTILKASDFSFPIHFTNFR